ncbi:hypothetical protein Tco_0123900 [Tanacetum coccineum]
MTLRTHKLRTQMSSAVLYYSPPQDEHHHEDSPDLLGERQRVYMWFVVLKDSQTSSEVQAILLCLVVAIEDFSSSCSILSLKQVLTGNVSFKIIPSALSISCTGGLELALLFLHFDVEIESLIVQFSVNLNPGIEVVGDEEDNCIISLPIGSPTYLIMKIRAGVMHLLCTLMGLGRSLGVCWHGSASCIVVVGTGGGRVDAAGLAMGCLGSFNLLVGVLSNLGVMGFGDVDWGCFIGDSGSFGAWR